MSGIAVAASSEAPGTPAASPDALARPCVLAFRVGFSLLGGGLAVATALSMRSAHAAAYVAYLVLAFVFQFIWLGSPFPFALPFYTTMNAFAYIAGPPVVALEYLQRVVSYPLLAHLAERGWIALPPPLEPVIGALRGDRGDRLRAWIDHGTTGTLGALGILVRAYLSSWLRTSGDVSFAGSIAITEYTTLAVLGLLHLVLPLPVAAQLRRGGWRWWRLDDERVDLIVVVLLVAPIFVFLINFGYRLSGLPGAIGFSIATLGPHVLTKLSTDRLTRVTSLLEQKQAELKDLVSTVAHDLKSPVESALITVDMVLDRDGATIGSAARADLELAIGLLARTEAMVRDLARVFRIVWEPEAWGSVSLDQVLAGVIEALAPKAHARHVQIWVSPLPAVWGQAGKLEHAFTNLVGNAIEHARPDGGRVSVHAETTNGFVTICVRDDGLGIPADYQRRIFELYTRVPGPRPGSGVGLSIVKRVVEAHGGTVWVESEVGDGSRFYVRLPSVF